MAELYLIRLDATNVEAFDELFRVTNPPEGIECLTVSDPEHTAAVNAFLNTHEDKLLPVSAPIKTQKGEGVFYSRDGSEVTSIPAPAAPEDPRRADYIEQLHKMIFVDVRDQKNADGVKSKGVYLSMDPLPLGERIGVFFRGSEEETWSILHVESMPKLKYIGLLLNHTGLEELGLAAQLSLYKFKDGTQILSRNYMMQYGVPGATPFEGAGTMYVRKPDGTVKRFMVPEDSFVEFFEAKKDYIANLIKTYGPLAEKPINVTKSSQCVSFVKGETHFSVYRTQRTKDRNTIDGNSLQRDADGAPVIQKDDASMLEPLIEKVHRQLQIKNKTVKRPRRSPAP